MGVAGEFEERDMSWRPQHSMSQQAIEEESIMQRLCMHKLHIVDN